MRQRQVRSGDEVQTKHAFRYLASYLGNGIAALLDTRPNMHVKWDR